MNHEQTMQYALRLQRMIQCETISQPDHYDDTAFAKLRRVMRELFPLLHQQAACTIFGEDCWLYELKGASSDHSILLMSHHDVVAAPGNWKHPAFSGEIAEGCIWGRGTVDTKTSLFAEFSAIEELLASGQQLPCTIYIASSHNEEISGDGIPKVVAYFKEHQIVPDFILDEGGAVIDPPMAGIQKKCAVLAVHEKGRYQITFVAEPPKEHGGFSSNTQTPTLRLARFIIDLQDHEPYIRRFSPELRAMFEALAPHMRFPMKQVFGHLSLFSPLLKRLIPKLNVQAGAMLGTTGTFQKLASDEHGCSVKLMLRPINEEDLAIELERINAIAKKYAITVCLNEQEKELYRSAVMEGTAWEHVRSCMAAIFPDTIVMPFILPAGTDARHFCEICPHVYRFAPLDINNQQFKSVHGENENLLLDAIPKAVVFYKQIITDYPIKK